MCILFPDTLRIHTFMQKYGYYTRNMIYKINFYTSSCSQEKFPLFSLRKQYGNESCHLHFSNSISHIAIFLCYNIVKLLQYYTIILFISLSLSLSSNEFQFANQPIFSHSANIYPSWIKKRKLGNYFDHNSTKFLHHQLPYLQIQIPQNWTAPSINLEPEKAVRIEQIPWTIGKRKEGNRRRRFPCRTPWSSPPPPFVHPAWMETRFLVNQGECVAGGGRYRRRIRQAIVINRRFDRKYHRWSTNCGLV